MLRAKSYKKKLKKSQIKLRKHKTYSIKGGNRNNNSRSKKKQKRFARSFASFEFSRKFSNGEISANMKPLLTILSAFDRVFCALYE